MIEDLPTDTAWPSGTRRGKRGPAQQAEADSEHPLARAVVKEAQDRGLVPPEVDSFEALPGRGVVTHIAGREVLVGSPRFVRERGIHLAPLADRIGVFEEAGRTVIVVGREGQALGLVALGDRLKADAVETVAALQRAGLRTILVTGDNDRAARRIAREAGIDEVHAAGSCPARRPRSCATCSATAR